MGGKVSTLSNSGSYCPKDGANGEDKKDKRHKHSCPFDLFMAGHSVARDSDCHGIRQTPTGPYVWRSYEQVLTDALSLGAYLCTVLGLAKGSFVGTLSTNCAELGILELACYAYGLAIVPLYDTLGEDACAHIVKETGLSIVFCRGAKQVKTVLGLCDKMAAKQEQFTIVCVEEGVDSANLQLRTFAEAVDEGAKRREEVKRVQPEPDDLALICYTSGTTGLPKGVMLSNKNLVSCVHLVKDTIAEDVYRHPVVLNSADTFFSYLPMAHILERMAQLYCYCQGVRIGFFTGDRARLMDDLRECRPTFLIAVPKVISRIYDATNAAAAGSRIKQALLQKAVRSKTESLKSGAAITNSSFWDCLLFRRVQAGLGGRVRFLAIGGAPISPDVLQFAKAALGCPVVQGFGQTETCGLGLCQRPGDPAPDQTGQPMQGAEVKLIDVPEMNYFASEGHGEVCIRSDSCFSGYYKQKEKTAEVLDSDGWVHTGDVAVKLSDGSYRVIDRAKHLFKLAQGEYVAPEKIELVYCLLPIIDQAFVDGNSQRSWLLGIVVPNKEVTAKWASENGMSDTAFDTVCQLDQFKEVVLRQMLQLGREKGLLGFEQVKDIAIVTEPFTVDNNLLTPTLKLKRPQLRTHFADKFNDMYSRLDR